MHSEGKGVEGRRMETTRREGGGREREREREGN
jgi:hypothetical protein